MDDRAPERDGADRQRDVGRATGKPRRRDAPATRRRRHPAPRRSQRVAEI